LKQSQEYAVKMNDIIEGWQEDIDSTVFGPWLNTTTVVLNGTLVKFYDEVEKSEWCMGDLHVPTKLIVCLLRQ
jgi:hypothetical protein